MAFGFLGGRVPKSAGDLAPAWAFPLPRRFVPGSEGPPRALLREGLILCWEESTLIALDASDGSVQATRKLEGRVVGLDSDGQLLLARPGGALRLGLPDLTTSEANLEELIHERRATDAPENPEQEPFLVLGHRRLKARLETKSRVTRHHLEVCDEGHPPRECEIAAYTLRSDRFTLASRGNSSVMGWVGESGFPLASVAGGARGPVVVLRKRTEEWHEHRVSGSSDLVAHGNSSIGALLVPEGHQPVRATDLGRLSEEWTGLGRRNSAPARLERGSALRAIGLAGKRVIAEVVDVAASRGAPAPLPKRRTIVALDISAAC